MQFGKLSKRQLLFRYDLGCERWHLAVHLLDALFLNDEGHAAAGIYYPEIRNCSGKGQAAAQRISELEQEIPEIVKKGTKLWIGWDDSGIMRLIA